MFINPLAVLRIETSECHRPNGAATGSALPWTLSPYPVLWLKGLGTYTVLWLANGNVATAVSAEALTRGCERD